MCSGVLVRNPNSHDIQNTSEQSDAFSPRASVKFVHKRSLEHLYVLLGWQWGEQVLFSSYPRRRNCIGIYFPTLFDKTFVELEYNIRLLQNNMKTHTDHPFCLQNLKPIDGPVWKRSVKVGARNDISKLIMITDQSGRGMSGGRAKEGTKTGHNNRALRF